MNNTLVRHITTLIFLLTCSTWMQAQYSYAGVVRDFKTKEPLADAVIRIASLNRVVDCNEQGFFEIKDLPVGNYDLECYSIDHKDYFGRINIQGNLVQDIYMQELAIKLDAISIQAKRKEIFQIKQLKDVEGTAIFAGKKTEVVLLEKVKGNLASNTSRQVFAQISGLNIYEGSDGGLQMNIGGRGLDPNRTSNFNTRQNGYDISADVLGYPESYYSPPSEALSEIRIVRGASSLQYGTQFGGLINFKLRSIPTYKPYSILSKQTIGSFGLFNSFNQVGINAGKWSINTFVNHKFGKGYRKNSDYRASNIFLSLAYKINKKSSIRAEYTYYTNLAKQAGGLTDSQFATTPRLSTRTRNWFAVNWNLFDLEYKYKINASSNFSLQVFGLFAQRNALGFRGNPSQLNSNPILALDEQSPDGQFILPRDLIRGTFRNMGTEARYIKNLNLFGNHSVWLTGFKLYQSDNSSIQGAGSKGSDADFTIRNKEFPNYNNQSTYRFPNFNAALFSEYIWYINDKFSITPGCRLEYIHTKAKGTYSNVLFDIAGNPIDKKTYEENRSLPRFFSLLGIGVSYKPKKYMEWIANISQNYRSVTFSDIRIVSPTFKVDPKIRDERGFTLDLGLRGRYQNFLAYELTSYAIFYNDRIGIILDNRANRVRKNIGQAIILGTESLLSFNVAKYLDPYQKEYQAELFVNSAYTYSRYLRSEEQNVVGKKVEFIPRINIKTGLSLGYKDFSMSTQFSFVDRQFTDVQNSAPAADGGLRDGIIGDIPAYHIWDIHFGYNYKKFGIEAGINNLLDKKYFTRRATGYPGPGIIPSSGQNLYATFSFKI